MEDPYTTLGISREAGPDDIRKAYRNLAKKHHPDLNPGNAKAEERFKSIAAANEILSDPIKRGKFDRGEIDAAGQDRPPEPSYRHYAEGDAGRRYGPEAAGWNPDDLNDMFNAMFNEDQPRRGKSKRRGQDASYILTTDFLDAVNGATRRLHLPDARTLDVKIPAGAIDGLVLRLRGQGGPGANGAEPGDALIEIRVTPHAFYERIGQDIRLVLPVNLSEAVLGGSIAVPTPGGTVRMQIPAHSDSGTELRLRGRGVPAHKGHPAGDLYATLRIVLGTADPALETFLNTWTPEHPSNPRHAMDIPS